jgi:hypothetical protein
MFTRKNPAARMLKVNLIAFKYCSRVPTMKHCVNRKYIGSILKNPAKEGLSTLAKLVNIKLMEVAWLQLKLLRNYIFLLIMELIVEPIANLTYYWLSTI